MAGSFGDWFGTLQSTFKVGKSTLSASGIASSRTHTLPDAAGTVALTADTYGGIAPRGHIAGLLLANNGTDANNYIDISVGEATDSTATYLIKLSSGITKRLNAAWAAGTNAGGLDTGSKAASTWYHVWLIRKDSDGSADTLFSTSVSSPTMPSGYTYKRLIGSVVTNASSNIRQFLSYEIEGGGVSVWYKTPTTDINLTNTLGLTTRTDVVASPLGLVTKAYLTVELVDTTTIFGYMSSPDLSDVAPSTTSEPFYNMLSSTAGTARQLEIFTNTSSQVRAKASANTVDNYYVSTYGWTWGRR